MTFSIDCRDKTTRDINRQLARGDRCGTRAHPHPRTRRPAQPRRRPVAAGACGLRRQRRLLLRRHDGRGLIEVRGSAGWGTAESMLGGTVVIDGNAGSGVAASIRGGTVVVRGDAAARAGVSMKGGTLLIGGNCGYMAGFMMQKGRIVICGDAGDALADSMYEGVVFVGGQIASRWATTPSSRSRSAEDRAWLNELLVTYRCAWAGAFRRSSRAVSCGTSTARTSPSGRRPCERRSRTCFLTRSSFIRVGGASIDEPVSQTIGDNLESSWVFAPVQGGRRRSGRSHAAAVSSHGSARSEPWWVRYNGRPDPCGGVRCAE